jgi:hypothetical protein
MILGGGFDKMCVNFEMTPSKLGGVGEKSVFLRHN